MRNVHAILSYHSAAERTRANTCRFHENSTLGETPRSPSACPAWLSARSRSLPRSARVASPSAPPARSFCSASGWHAGNHLPSWRATRRKPQPLYRESGLNLPRYAERQHCGLPQQLPPRRTRSSPEAGPVGSVTAPDGYVPNQSAHHSRTLPCMSYNPQAFGCFCFTGCALRTRDPRPRRT